MATAHDQPTQQPNGPSSVLPSAGFLLAPCSAAAFTASSAAPSAAALAAAFSSSGRLLLAAPGFFPKKAASVGCVMALFLGLLGGLVGWVSLVCVDDVDGSAVRVCRGVGPSGRRAKRKRG